MVLVIAHRGYNAKYPENTLLSFKKGLEVGSDGIELDVHSSLDGKLVVMHDEKLERTTNGFGKISEVSYDDYISKLDAGNGEHVPLLEEALELCKENNALINIEIKARDIEKQVIDLVKHHGML
ncbi:MAG: glycerophosphodiester phosphodiesterase family protein, partial [Promethearchaeota archaeon]